MIECEERSGFIKRSMKPSFCQREIAFLERKVGMSWKCPKFRSSIEKARSSQLGLKFIF